MKKIEGCSDHACLIQRPAQGTNGGKCRCSQEALRRFIEKLKKLAAQLPDSDDPDACDPCRIGEHLKCVDGPAGNRCGCEFCC